MSDRAPLILPYAGTTPSFASPVIHVGEGAAVLGRATLGTDAWLGARSVIRADGHYVKIGDDFHLGAGSTVHIAHDFLPTEIGNGVTAGCNTVVHACTVGDNVYLGDDVVILDGSKVASGCALADGSIVFPRSELEGGWYYEGMPAKPVRRLEEGELETLHAKGRARSDAAPGGRTGAAETPAGTIFVAASARLSGRVLTEGDNGIWFGCDLDAGGHAIRVGRNTNIQDNSILRCDKADLVIGKDATIGHNVTMSDCTVGDRSLVGIGAVVAPGTRIGNDVLLAAGARTESGQVLEDGSFYAGRPAKRMAALDDRKRMLIAGTWPTYCDYARRFAAAQKDALGG
jgi:carbonic anhydrase/acetyltransferase-like protein (isoleucine patch superfamily)